MQIKAFAIRTLVALVALTIGVIAVALWVVPRFRTVTPPHAALVSETLKDEETPLPEGWKRLEMKAGPPPFRDVQQTDRPKSPETRGRITIGLPPDMEPDKADGDSFVYREAYRNRDIFIVIGYGEIVTRRNKDDRPLDPCDTPSFLRELPAFQESIDRR